jgi:hypothetical protein
MFLVKLFWPGRWLLTAATRDFLMSLDRLSALAVSGQHETSSGVHSRSPVRPSPVCGPRMERGPSGRPPGSAPRDYSRRTLGRGRVLRATRFSAYGDKAAPPRRFPLTSSDLVSHHLTNQRFKPHVPIRSSRMHQRCRRQHPPGHTYCRGQRAIPPPDSQAPGVTWGPPAGELSRACSWSDRVPESRRCQRRRADSAPRVRKPGFSCAGRLRGRAGSPRAGCRAGRGCRDQAFPGRQSR